MFTKKWQMPTLLMIILLPIQVMGQQPLAFSVSVDPQVVRPGETATVWIDVTLFDDWHIYSTTTPPGGPVPTEIALSGEQFQQVGAAIQPPPTKEHDPNFDMQVEYYGKEVRFGIRAQISDSAPPGPTTLQGEVTYMLCNETSCLPPTTHAFELPVEIETGSVRATYTYEPEPTTAPGGGLADIQAAVSQGLFAFLTLSFGMGLLALLTPCVFPMIPITISFFTQQASRSRAEAVFKSLFYCTGIVATFTGLGALLALTLGASGTLQFAASPYVNLFIAGIFFAFTLSLFGLFEIQIPPMLLNRLNQVQGGDYGAILVMGLTFSLASFACTAPFVGALLVLTTQGTWLWPILGMAAFSTAFSLPFFFLSLFPQGLSALPKSGGWLNSVKVVMGFLVLAAALKFLSVTDAVWGWGIFSREVLLAFWVAIFALCGIYLLGKIRLIFDAPLDVVGPFRLLCSLGSFALSLYLLTGLFGAHMGEIEAFLPASKTPGAFAQTGAGGETLDWHRDYDSALAEARATGKPIFIDFTGYACTNCRWMESNMFPHPEVQALLKDHIRVKLYTDGQGEVYDRNRSFQQQRFETVALPFYAVFSPEDREIARFAGLTRDREQFVRFLQTGLTDQAPRK